MTKQKNKNHIILFFLICFLFFIFPLFSVKADCCTNSQRSELICGGEGENTICQDVPNCSFENCPYTCLSGFCSQQSFCKETGCCKEGVGKITCASTSRLECQYPKCFSPGKGCKEITECAIGEELGCCKIYLNVEKNIIKCTENEKISNCVGSIEFNKGMFCLKVKGCPQYVEETKPTEPTKPAPPLKFIPSVTIPGSSFEAGKGIDVSGKLIGQYISAIFEFAVAVSAFLALVMIMLAGIKWMFAAGSSEKVGEARKMIGNAIIGLILSLATYTILSLINPNLVLLKEINVTQIKRIELEIQKYIENHTGSISEQYQNMSCPTSAELTKGVEMYITGYYKSTRPKDKNDRRALCMVAMNCGCPNDIDTSAKDCRQDIFPNFYNKGKPYYPCKFFGNNSYCTKTSIGEPHLGDPTTVAADWSCISKGTKLCIRGKNYIVEDQGGDIKKRRIDIWSGNSVEDANGNTGKAIVKFGPCQ